MRPPGATDFAALATIHSAWYPPWLVSLLCQRGRAHYRQGIPTQDGYAAGGNDHALWMVVSDGIGSQPRSHYGSRIACQAVAHACDMATANGHQPTTETLRSAFGAAHTAINEHARNDNRPIAEYGATLSAVLIAGDTIVAASLGDSGIVAYTLHEKAGTPTPAITPFCSAPQPPLKNQTYAITNPDWQRALTARASTSPHIKAIVITTDGKHHKNKQPRVVIYATECNPKKLPFETWWANKQATFGGDDGVDFIDAAELRAIAAELRTPPKYLVIAFFPGTFETYFA